MSKGKIIASLVIVVGLIGSLGYFSSNSQLFSGNSFDQTIQYCMSKEYADLQQDPYTPTAWKHKQLCDEAIQKNGKAPIHLLPYELIVQRHNVGPYKKIALAGQKDVTVMHYRFVANGGDVLVEDVKFDYLGNGFDEVKSFKIYDFDNQNSVLGTAEVKNGVVSFDNIDLTIPEDDYKIIVLKADMFEISESADSGDIFYVDLSHVKAKSMDKLVELHADQITIASNIQGDDVIVRGSMPKFARIDYTHNKIFVGKDVPLYKLKVEAINDKISLGILTFSLSGTLDGVPVHVAPEMLKAYNFRLFDVDAGYEVPDAELFFDKAYQNAYLRFGFLKEQLIGSTKTYELRADFPSLKSGDKFNVWFAATGGLQLEPLTDSLDNISANLNQYPADQTFWSDLSAKNHSYSSLDWTHFSWLPTNSMGIQKWVTN